MSVVCGDHVLTVEDKTRMFLATARRIRDCSWERERAAWLVRRATKASSIPVARFARAIHKLCTRSVLLVYSAGGAARRIRVLVAVFRQPVVGQLQQLPAPLVFVRENR